MKKKILEKTLFVLLALATVYVMLPFAGCNGSNPGNPSSSSSGSTSSGGTVPSVPAGLTPTVKSASQIDLSWTASASADATGYRVYRGGVQVGGDITTGTAYSDTGLTSNTTYTYEVSAYNAAGESAKSTSASAKTQGSQPLPTTAPKNVTLDYSTIDATWTALNQAPLSHGSMSPDKTKMLITANGAVAGVPPSGGHGFAMVLFDAKQLEGGTLALASGTNKNFQSTPSSSVFYRSTWSADGKLIAAGAGDRVCIIDAATLKTLNDTDPLQDQCDKNTGSPTAGGADVAHDAMFTNDGKYAVAVVRGADSKSGQDTQLQIFKLDAAGKTKRIGTWHDGASICNRCHGFGGTGANHGLNAWGCGMDGELIAQADGTYKGKIWVGGEGGHAAVMDVVLDPAKPEPLTITVLARDYLRKMDTGEWLHDVRWDKERNILFWSTILADANGKLHQGSFSPAYPAGGISEQNRYNGSIDHPIDPVSGSASPYYCASGQTDGYVMQVSMSSKPAYLTVTGKGYLTAP